MNNFQTRFYPETLFGGFTDVDGTIVFYSRIHSLIDASFVVLDFGCGRGGHTTDSISFRQELRCFKGKASKAIGIDVDTVGHENTSIDEFRLITEPSRWPLDDGTVNLIICDNVLEHLPDPSIFFSEARRVLAPSGYLCIRTPNKFSYVGMISRLVPNKAHATVLKKAQPGRQSEDIFPTLYRCNTISAVRKQMSMNGFRSVVYGYEAEPSYLEFSVFAYALGVLHQKICPGFMRQAIFAFGHLTT